NSPANRSIVNLRGTTGLERHRLLSLSIVYGLRFLPPSIVYASSSSSISSLATGYFAPSQRAFSLSGSDH
ncbi:unnamed protein product, partial [Prunus brigantina]